jgi:hypothetical protein
MKKEKLRRTDAARIMLATGENATVVTVDNVRPYTTLASEAFSLPCSRLYNMLAKIVTNLA